MGNTFFRSDSAPRSDELIAHIDALLFLHGRCTGKELAAIRARYGVNVEPPARRYAAIAAIVHKQV